MSSEENEWVIMPSIPGIRFKKREICFKPRESKNDKPLLPDTLEDQNCYQIFLCTILKIRK